MLSYQSCAAIGIPQLPHAQSMSSRNYRLNRNGNLTNVWKAKNKELFAFTLNRMTAMLDAEHEQTEKDDDDEGQRNPKRVTFSKAVEQRT